MRLCNFRNLMTMFTLMLVGIALIPRLDIGSKPRERQGSTLQIGFSWPGTAAKVVEQDVTSRIEGAVSAVKGVKSVTSESRYGGGQLTVELKPETNPSHAKFEISSLLRQMYKRLPEGVSHPWLSGGDVVTGERRKDEQTLLLTYQVHSDMTARQLKQWCEQSIEPRLKAFDEVRCVETVGGTDRYMKITYDPQALQAAGIAASDIEDALRSFTGREDIVGDVMRDDARQTLILRAEPFSKPLAQMPIGNGRYLNDLITVETLDREPDYFYRVNGLETVYLNIYVAANSNMIAASQTLREEMAEVMASLPKSIQLEQTYDGAEAEQGQLYRLVTRSLASLLILLLFTWIASRSLRYLAVVAVTLAACVLISVVAYWLMDIRLHVYSLAGITVSLGLVIDASIVMIDHYRRYRNRTAFRAILTALLTTIASLSLITVMPEYIRRDLDDLALIVIINLCVAMAVALWFVPALVDSIDSKCIIENVECKMDSHSNHSELYIINSKFYYKFVSLCQRFRWVGYAVVILAFGLPFFALPDHLGDDRYFGSEDNETWYESLYNTTLGNKTFVRDIKPVLSKCLGGTMRLFAESLDASTFAREEEEMKLNIRAEMPQGGTAAELNAKVLLLENALKEMEGIRRWETTVGAWGANITVIFTEDALGTAVPYQVENRVIGKVIGIGGADWSTHGVSQRGFSNSLNLQYRQNSIEIAGYNYDRLYRFAEDIEQTLRRNPRATDIVIETPGHERQEEEYHVVYDRKRIALLGIDLGALHRAVSSLLAKSELGHFIMNENSNSGIDLQLVSSRRDSFDLWQLLNSYVRVGERDLMLRDVMQISRREAKNIIPRKNQQYYLRVAFNILGSYTYADRYIRSVTDEANAHMPVGFRCTNSTSGWYQDTGQQYWLILIIAVIIYFLCAIHFESLLRPLAIIMLIPASLIGTFLTFYWTGIPFGTGGFASMALLCGLAVNAGIYLLDEYDDLCNTKDSVACYVAAFRHKLMPVLLTVLSTVLGLVPFLWDGADEPFWYSFAVGTIGGMATSLLAFIFAMPVFINLKRVLM